MTILAIDSSALPVSCAIARDHRMTAEFTINLKMTHSETLMPLIHDVLEKSGMGLKDIDALAVSGGPGSFTGLRIGSATVKGLGEALNIPVIPVPTLKALAYNVFCPDTFIVPVMDARRRNTYTAIYEYEGENLKTVMEQCIIPLHDLLEKLDTMGKKAVFTGDGTVPFRDEIEETLTVTHYFAPPHLFMQKAGAVAVLAEKLFEEGKYTDASAHRPDYLKLSQAEQELKSARSEGRLADLAEGTYISKKKKISESLIIRQMKKEDARELAETEREIFGKSAWSENDFVETTALEYAYYLVAEDSSSGRIAGVCGYRDMCGEADITNVCTIPGMRRRGIAEMLLTRLMEYGKDHGVRDFTLEVRAENDPAINLYKKLGFKEEGRRPGFYENPVDDAIIMWKRYDA